MRHTIVTLGTALLAHSARASLGGPLQFSEEGTFQISIFEDLHFGENAWESWGPAQDAKSITVLNKVLDAESRPDLVVLNGDLITGENTFLENSTSYVDQIVAPFVARGLPWASTYGNHDGQYNLSSTALLARENKYPGSLTQSMVPGREAGVTNYYLPVYGSGTRRPWSAPKLILWFFDSRGGSYFQERDDEGNEVPRPNWVDYSVVRWFRRTNNYLTGRYRKTIPSLVFVHIPTNASRAAQTVDGINEYREPGINDDYALAQQGEGWCEDGTNDNAQCPYGGQDEPLMEALVEIPGILGVFSGHDHGDTWCYKWDTQIEGMNIKGNGVNLCFGQHSGYGGYGNWIRGARQVLVEEKALKRGELDTWIRLESGDVVGSVSLNATYGEELYPATPNDKTYL
ncbi:Metallo-dependent phosphatase-like protein [Aspergillus pseudoustus]|uniref:Metallo-dependent phosphatase-like protein n=1 Tax=Aspergillus pseudoustus TaxID=1810923 RepID=A0ABR4JQ47_9EURO